VVLSSTGRGARFRGVPFDTLSPFDLPGMRSATSAGSATPQLRVSLRFVS
jgi:hypothetical protein